MKIVHENRRAKFDYDILEHVDAGMVLSGGEVKSCRAGHVDLRGSYVSFLSGKITLKQAKIARYAFTTDPAYDPAHDRELLLHKSERGRLEALSTEKGMTVVPIAVMAGKFIKVRLAVARGRKTFDKRHRIREREVERSLRGREE